MGHAWYAMSAQDIDDLNALEVRRSRWLARKQSYADVAQLRPLSEGEKQQHDDDERSEERYHQLVRKRQVWLDWEQHVMEEESEDRRGDFDPISWPGEH